jgi:phosphatidylcholine synthase
MKFDLPIVTQAHSRIAAAWAVHAFTATGVMLGLFALFATFEGYQQNAFLWLGLALFVDGIDGSLARRFHVRELTPHFDGATLDNVVDYTTYTFIPALMVYHFGMVPQGFGVVAACFIALTSLYCFANTNMKTSDYYFRGFPAVWNIVVLYLHILRTPEWINLGVIALCGILTFVPWKYVHPLRVARFRPATIAATVLWCFTSFWLIFDAEKPMHPAFSDPLAFAVWIAATLYFGAICAIRTVAEPVETASVSEPEGEPGAQHDEAAIQH